MLEQLGVLFLAIFQATPKAFHGKQDCNNVIIVAISEMSY